MPTHMYVLRAAEIVVVTRGEKNHVLKSKSQPMSISFVTFFFFLFGFSSFSFLLFSFFYFIFLFLYKKTAQDRHSIQLPREYNEHLHNTPPTATSQPHCIAAVRFPVSGFTSIRCGSEETVRTSFINVAPPLIITYNI